MAWLIGFIALRMPEICAPSGHSNAFETQRMQVIEHRLGSSGHGYTRACAGVRGVLLCGGSRLLASSTFKSVQGAGVRGVLADNT